MFNVGPMELLVLAVVALIVIGPDKLPNLARDAARMIKSLRELATGARQQLRDELGPEFADVDLSNLNPRTAVQRVVFGDDVDLSRLNSRTAVRDVLCGDDLKAADQRTALREAREDIRGELTARPSLRKDAPRAVDPAMGTALDVPAAPRASAPVASDLPRPRPRPRPAPRPAAPFDDDAT